MLTVFAVYLVVHLAAYVAGLRRLAALRTEQGIFLYHFGSAVITGLVAVAAAFILKTAVGVGENRQLRNLSTT